MGQTIYPQIPKVVKVLVASGQQTGTALHNMGTKPECGKPNPNVIDGASATADATADATTVTVTCEVPTSQDVTFTVLCMIM